VGQGAGAIAESVAHSLGLAMAGKYVSATLLTRRKSRSAQAVVKARKSVAKGTASSKVSRQRPSANARPRLWTCPDCRGAVTTVVT
jgi:hypothetical protein